jgi:hypothetical protein
VSFAQRRCRTLQRRRRIVQGLPHFVGEHVQHLSTLVEEPIQFLCMPFALEAPLLLALQLLLVQAMLGDVLERADEASGHAVLALDFAEYPHPQRTPFRRGEGQFQVPRRACAQGLLHGGFQRGPSLGRIERTRPQAGRLMVV